MDRHGSNALFHFHTIFYSAGQNYHNIDSLNQLSSRFFLPKYPPYNYTYRVILQVSYEDIEKLVGRDRKFHLLVVGLQEAPRNNISRLLKAALLESHMWVTSSNSLSTFISLSDVAISTQTRLSAPSVNLPPLMLSSIFPYLFPFEISIVSRSKILWCMFNFFSPPVPRKYKNGHHHPGKQVTPSFRI